MARDILFVFCGADDPNLRVNRTESVWTGSPVRRPEGGVLVLLPLLLLQVWGYYDGVITQLLQLRL